MGNSVPGLGLLLLWLPIDQEVDAAHKPPPPLDSWNAMQLRHYLRSIKQMDKIFCAPSLFAQLCIDAQPLRHAFDALFIIC